MAADAFAEQSPESVLFITLDSCRFDTFEASDAATMKAVAPLHCAQAPSHYTYGSHAAMFVGFTPGLAHLRRPVLNPKFGKLFKIVGAGFPGKGSESYELRGRNIVEGFANLGFATIGTAAMGWFDPATDTGRTLTESFEHFRFTGNFRLRDQLSWLAERTRACREQGRDRQFVFLNVGETHVPYWHEGAPWSVDDNPCVPFQTVDRAHDCRVRQRRCCEFVDGELRPLIAAFMGSTILICGDHGDCWGEDDLWEHGISHPATLSVPLLARVRGAPVRA